MKRSEVIESIVYECLSWSGLDTNGVPAEEIANDVLTHLEKLGMLPPMQEIKQYEFQAPNEWDEE